ncbi:PLP-dependent aminotransferase family protein [Aliagarivorans taiwanensis]|uniref:aminotransferase-like domain-containing protein n=1 Tax=Aliagarivorans taiwanensis TaxID=561966 RepID=UPI0003F9CBF8|nr:PLP-dependent aminotransferase family protein [Aliagarivorans taiwanensis]
MLVPNQAVRQTRSSYIRNILNVAQQQQVLSLAGGLPNPELFPLSLLKQAAAELANSPQCYQYGATLGLGELREHLRPQQPIAGDVLITTGSQQALDLIARAYISPGDKIICEVPAYLGALQIFELAQAQIIGIPSVTTGPDLEVLEQQLIEHKPKLFYTVPDFHNPTGRCWDLSTRQAVARLMERYGVTLIEDAPYSRLRYRGEALPAVSSLGQGDSFFLGSFSKIGAPGMRVGYVNASSNLIEPMAKVKQACDLHSAVPMQQMCLWLLQQPTFEAHLDNLTSHYRQNLQHLAMQLTESLADHLVFSLPEGGMFLWASLKHHNASDLAAAALAHGVAVVPGDEFWPQGEASEQAIRLNFSALNTQQLDLAVKRLSQAFASLG